MRGDASVTGLVEEIWVAAAESGPMAARDRVVAHAGRGLEGDRYLRFERSSGAQAEDNLTLIERAAYDHLADLGIEVAPGALRRNLVTSGIALNDLVGRRFRVGAVECRGVERADPCRHLEGLTRDGVLRGLVERGGLRAEILTDGEIRLGDAVEADGSAD